MKARAPALAIAALLAGCASAPAPLPPPDLKLPAAWKAEPPFREARPADGAPKGPWWQRLGDAQLSALQEEALARNATLEAAVARLAQAQAVLAAAGAARFPQLAFGARAARQRVSANRPLASYTGTNFATVQNDFTAAFSVAYEVDLFGRIDGTVAAAQAGAEQAAADLANARLVLGADLAAAWVNLRAVDLDLDIVERSVGLQRRALQFVSERRAGGAASGLEVAQQQALLDSTLTQRDLLQRQRALFVDAIATLVGTPAPSFTVAPALVRFEPPPVPAGVPSDLLERRPDVAAAERAMAAANAQLGVARAAGFPSVTLGAGYGAESRVLSSLLDAPSILWSLGAQAAQVLFDGGRLKANEAFAKAGWDLAAANYRRTVLGAMQEVEDGLAGAAHLGRAAAQAEQAAESARRLLALSSARYEGGAGTYLEVITAQQGALAAERLAAQLQSQQVLASVFLVKALGGGW